VYDDGDLHPVGDVQFGEQAGDVCLDRPDLPPAKVRETAELLRSTARHAPAECGEAAVGPE
jgi:hypothetical protein